MSQCADIELFLQSGHELTPLEALEMFRCFRLAARIDELRARGVPIATRMVHEGGKAYAAYRLARPVQAELFTEARI